MHDHSPDVFCVEQKIAHYQSLPPEQQTTHVGSIEDNPEYHLLTRANTLSTQIDTEVQAVHKVIRDHYSARFPELETLITGPIEYAKAVAIIGNGPMNNVRALSQKTDNLTGASLQSVLDGPTLMVVTVEATTTRGRPMPKAELAAVQRACAMTLSLERAKRTLGDYVQSRMTVFAPNLTEVVGSLTAAQLLNATGGLTGLAQTPDRNLPALGSKGRMGAATGRAANVNVRQQGYVYHASLVRGVPDDLKRQAMRIVSAKIVLAARVDLVHRSADGADGARLRAECLDRLDKLTAPPPNRGPKAIPPPDDKLSRKRGGRRARKAKEATAPTELRRAQNRMAFGKEEAEVGYGAGEGTVGMGMVGQADAGRIRALQVDQRTRAKLSKSNKGWGTGTPVGGAGTASSLRGFGQGPSALGNASVLRTHGLRSSGVGAASGTASSIAFTPVQGLELADPGKQQELKRKREAEDDRWFRSGTFTQVGGGGSVVPGAAGGKADGGFKVPSVPTKGDMGPPPSKKVA